MFFPTIQHEGKSCATPRAAPISITTPLFYYSIGCSEVSRKQRKILFDTRPPQYTEKVDISRYMCNDTCEVKSSSSLLRHRNTRGHSESEGDHAGGGMGSATARDLYREACKENGGVVPAGSEAAEMMRAAATPDVRLLCQKDCEDLGFTPKGGEAARKASEETEKRRPRPNIRRRSLP